VIPSYIKDYLDLGMPLVLLIGVAWQTIMVAMIRLSAMKTKRAADHLTEITAQSVADDARMRAALRFQTDMMATNAANAAAAANVAGLHAANVTSAMAKVTVTQHIIAKDVKEIAMNTNHLTELATVLARKEGEEAGRASVEREKVVEKAVKDNGV
jgi:hypothetical protein